ncbi:MAG: 50S ribosomal protein L24 [Chlamydiae bacterium]|nr:50S ribosomal protein L24 [Chlamydiota bacterium]NGX46795.1 50S ribosomal protein L24 [Chlamydiota bacterium]
MSNKWIRKGVKVVVIAGNEKGQVGNVLARDGDRIVIEGLNIRKKHVKPKQRMQPGIVEMEGPMHISNVSLCDEDGKPLKLKVKIGKEGKKELIFVKAGKEIIYRDVKKKKN